MTDGTPDVAPLAADVTELLNRARRMAANQVNAVAVVTNVVVGRRMVLHEQGGEGVLRAGALNAPSVELTADLGRATASRTCGYSESYTSLSRSASQFLTMSGKSLGRSQTVTGIIAPDKPSCAMTLEEGKSADTPWFPLNWSHYVLLVGLSDPDERALYEVEARTNGWSLAKLRLQVQNCLYERLALCRDKDGVLALCREGEVVTTPVDALKDPYVLEFLGLEDHPRYSESDLEGAIIDKLEHFLLKLGKGFLFEGRQRRFSFDEQNFFVDLVFYSRLLRCLVLIDLKIGKITQQDLGQMQMYVNFCDRHVKLVEERPAVGISLCKQNQEAMGEAL